jgi:hypothetical protein
VTPPRIRYSDLRAGITSFLADQRRDARALATLGNLLEQKANDSSLSNFARQDAQLSFAALSAFQRMTNQLAGFTFAPAPSRQRALTLGGVVVSIQLDLLVTRARGQQTECGGVLLRLAKTDEDETDAAAGKRRQMGEYAATLAQMQVRASHGGNGTPHHALCLSVDVQAGEVHAAPRNFAQKAQRLEAECRFIAALWGTA